MDEKDLQEFTLDEIMKEFASEGADTVPEAEQEQLPEDTVFDEAAAELALDPDAFAQAVAQPIEDEPLAQTIRLDAIPEVRGQVRNAQPVEEETVLQEPEAPEQEAFSENWEPEYEQPMGEYVPPQPIVFHPRSRLRELKRKLVAGPEKQYYALSEKGLGKLQIAIFFSLLVVLISAVTTLMYHLGMVQENRMRLMVFGQFLAMLISAILGSFQMIDGVMDLFHKRFTLNTLLVFTFIACCADGILCLKLEQVPCCAAFSLEVTMSLWSSYQRRNATMGQLDTMRKATRLDGVSAVPDYFDGRVGLLRSEGQVEDFMDTYDRQAKPEKVLGVYGIVALVLSVGVGITAAVLHSVWLGVRVTAVTLLAAMPATMFISYTRPLAILERRLHSLGTVLCGWSGVEKLSQRAVFPVGHDDLFPAGTVKMNGVKFYSKREPDETVAYCTALICAQGGGLESLFTQLLDSRNGVHYTAQNLRSYDGGIGGEVNAEPVLVGSLSFLSRMGVEVPEGIRVGQAVCVAVDGELCGLFAVAYEKTRSASAGIATLCAYRGLRPIFTENDFTLTPGFIKGKFNVEHRKLEFPEHTVREQLRQREPEAAASLLTTAEGLAPLAYGVTGARALKTAGMLGAVIHILGGALGIAMMLVLAILGAGQLLTPGNLFLYQLIWMIPGLVITEWTRVI